MKQYEYRPHSSKWQRPEMLKIYKIGNLTYQFEEGKQPSSAVEVKKAEAQKNGLALIVSRIDDINPKGYPMILTGDFNIKPNNPALVDLDKIMQSTRKIAQKTDNLATFNGWGKGKPDQVIDYIYVSGFSNCPEYQTVTKKYADRKFVSDHYPVCATLVF